MSPTNNNNYSTKEIKIKNFALKYANLIWSEKYKDKFTIEFSRFYLWEKRASLDLRISIPYEEFVDRGVVDFYYELCDFSIHIKSFYGLRIFDWALNYEPLP